MLAKVVLLASVITYCHGVQSLIDVIGANNGSTLISLIKKANLTATLSGPGPFTVLVPVDAAFAALPAAELTALTSDVDKLATVLKYHVVAGEEFSSDFVNGRILRTLVGKDLRVYKHSGDLFFNDAKVLVSDLQASNGVVYLIDRVLDVPEGTVMNILDSPAHNLTQFAAIVRRAHLDHRLNHHTSSYRYTVFAPSNAAFDKLPNAVKTLLTSSSSLYDREIVEYHVHHGTLHIKSLDHAGSIITLLHGHHIRVDSDTGNVRFNGRAMLEESDIEAENGVVHVIDNVLIPANLGHIIG